MHTLLHCAHYTAACLSRAGEVCSISTQHRAISYAQAEEAYNFVPPCQVYIRFTVHIMHVQYLDHKEVACLMSLLMPQ